MIDDKRTILKFLNDLQPDDNQRYASINKELDRRFRGQTVDNIIRHITTKKRVFTYFNLPKQKMNKHFLDFSFDKTDKILKELSDINNIDIAVKHRGIIKNGTFNPDHREPDYEREKELKRQARLKQERYLEYKKQRIQRIRRSDNRGNNSEPGQYNPSYNLIFKRAPVPFLGKPREKHAIIQEDKSLDKKEEDSKPKMLNKAQSAIDINSKKEELKLPRIDSSKDNKTKIKPIVIKEQPNMNKSKSHVLTKTIPKTCRSNKSNQDSNRVNNKGIDFNKMIGRNKHSKHISNTPGYDSYNPNYSSTMSQIKSVKFNYNQTLQEFKRALTKKVICNYDSDKEYCVLRINNEKEALLKKAKIEG